MAKKVGFADLAELKSKIRENSEEMMQNAYLSKVKNRVLNYIVKEYSFDLPLTPLNQEIEKRKKFLEDEQKMLKDDLDKEPEKKKLLTEKEMSKLAEEQATQSLKIGYLINSMVKENNIKVTEKEFDKEMYLYLSSHGLLNNAEFYNAMQNDPTLKTHMRSLILENKVFKHIYDKLNHKKTPVNQKQFEELMADLSSNPEKFN